MPKISEYDIHRAFYHWCVGIPNRLPRALLPGVMIWHTPNGGKREAFEAKRFKDIGLLPGFYDVCLLHRGGLYVLELKDDTGRLSQAQKDLWPRYVEAGVAGIAWANSLEGAKEWVRSWRLTVDSQHTGC